MRTRNYDILPILKSVLIRAEELKIRKIIITSSTGRSAQECLNFFDTSKFEIFMVTDRAHSYWPIDTIPENEKKEWLSSWPLEINDKNFLYGVHPKSEIAHKLYKSGLKGIIQGTEIFRGILLPGGINTNLVVAQTLYLFGVGVKVSVEAAVAACDAGVVSPGENIISLTLPPGEDSHAALVITASTSDEMFGVSLQSSNSPPLRVRDIISKGWY